MNATVEHHQQDIGAGVAKTIYLPTCAQHKHPWRGSPTYNHDLAWFNARIHDTDRHPATETMLDGLTE